MDYGQASLQEGLTIDTPTIKSESPVAVVIQTRIASTADDAYGAWQRKVGAVLEKWPGFLGQEVIQPNPPMQVDWFVIQRFKTLEFATAWMKSKELATMLLEVEQYFIGNDEIFISRPESPDAIAASAIVSCKVTPENEAAFLDWEREVMRAEAQFKGFRGHKLERPIPGVQDNWVIALTFASEQDLDGWLESSERANLIEKGSSIQESVQVRKASKGFDFWFQSPKEETAPTPIWIFKTNLLVLLVLYPIVYLWGYFISGPFIDAKGVPFWLSLFIGNVVSTQLLGFWVVPWIFKVFGWWIGPKHQKTKDFAGYLCMCALYVITIGIYAWLLAIQKK